MTVPVCPYCFNSLWENGHGQVFDYCLQCDQTLNKVFRMDLQTGEVQLIQPIVPDNISEENFKK